MAREAAWWALLVEKSGDWNPAVIASQQKANQFKMGGSLAWQ